MCCFRYVSSALLIMTLGLTLSCQRSRPTTSTLPPDTKTVTYTLEARITGYVGKGGDIDKVKNPTLRAKAGDRVVIKLINAENMAHDIKMETSGHASQSVLKVGEETTLSFIAQQSERYYCTLPGHKQAGMLGRFELTGSSSPVVSTPILEAASTKALEAVKPFDVDDIARDASMVPAPITRKNNERVELTIKSVEAVAKLEDGTSYTYWTFDSTVPGPMLRVKEGDDVVVHVDNDPKSTMVHSIDFHSVTGPGGGAAFLQVPPGQRRSLKFKALKAGLFVYHCATPHIPTHLTRGMYGLMLVEPKDGLPKVDREFYVMQGDLYTTAKPGTPGHQLQDDDRLFEERPTYVVFNGRLGALTGERALKAKVGETVRIYFGVGGPNTVSAFHVIGEIFDRVYSEGDLLSPPKQNVQTTLVPPGGSTVVEFKLDYPGKYILVDHALTRMDKGAVGILSVEGDADPSIYESLDPHAKPQDH